MITWYNHIFEIEREYYRLGKLDYGHPFKDINCQALGLHLCERCAGNISMEMYKKRVELCKGLIGGRKQKGHGGS